MNIVINLDKPKGITSQQAVTRVKKILGTKRAGHAGTLDPIATGILLVCVGEATKITRFLMGFDKEYVALMKIGEKTDTLDAEGTVVRRTDASRVGKEECEQALREFEGPIVQTPPMYSAVKVKGEPLYKLARKGVEIERAGRNVTIRALELTRFDPPWIGIRVLCSKGTYIRTLCDDIGDRLGVGAHMVELRRTLTGNFSILDALTFEELEGLHRADALTGTRERRRVSGADTEKRRGVSTIDEALTELDDFVLTEAEYIKARNGSSFRQQGVDFGEGTFIRLKDPKGHLFAIGKVMEGTIKIERILHVRD
jgi:tRNA pseudouridine55 synthase